MIISVKAYYPILELTILSDHGTLLDSSSTQGSAMPMRLLDRLSRETLPCGLTESRDLFNLHILKAAGYVQATIPLPYCSFDGRWHREPATVRRLTPLGRAVLGYLKPTFASRAPARDPAATDGAARIDSPKFKIPPRGGQDA
jgi:hypothetical protein